MPNRILREGILTSPRIARLGWAEEVFYRRMHSVVDDFGRYFADFGLLRAACYPRQLNKVSDSDIGKWLQVIADAGLVRVYPAEDGERYLELLDFRQQVRATKSKFPGPASTCAAPATQVQSNEHLDVFVSVDVDVITEPSGSVPATPEKTGDGAAQSPPSIAKARQRKERPLEAPPTSAAWVAYASAYRERYNADPVRNAAVNGQLANFVKRIPADEAPLVAAHFVSHNGPLYVSAMHPVNLLVRDAEKLRTEWATGRRGQLQALSFRERDQQASADRVHEITGGLVSAKPLTRRNDALQEIFDATPRLVG